MSQTWMAGLQSLGSSIAALPKSVVFAFFCFNIFGLILLSFLLLFILAPTPRPPHPKEKLYRALEPDGGVTQPRALPCWKDVNDRAQKVASKEGSVTEASETIEPAELFMTVVVPAYNEEDRITGMLEEAVNYLEHEYGTTANKLAREAQVPNGNALRHRPNGSTKTTNTPSTNPSQGYEILIINDGSRDATVDTALSFARTHQLPMMPRRLSGPWTHRAERAVNIPPGSIRIVSLIENRGKGGAVTHGMRHARGQYVVFADADGASKFDDLSKLVSACQKVEDKDGRGVAVGSRAHLVGSAAVVQRSRLRNFLMHSFHLLLKLMTPPRTAAIRDTQCGFKLFSRASLPFIVPYMHCEGWIFDVEMLMLAEFANIPVVEVPVGWREVMGSKLNVLWDSLGMAYGLALLRLCWGVGIYRRA